MSAIRVRNEQLILAAASEEFAAKGFDATQTSDIAARAGVPKANLYYYFQSKENLYGKVLLGFVEPLLEASADLGGKTWRTMGTVVLPLTFPAIIAGTIFAFSLSLGDYITVNIVGGANQMLGNLVYTNVGAANNLPFAAAVATMRASSASSEAAITTMPGRFARKATS